MKYLVMMLLILMLALSDIITGFIKGYVTDRPRSQKMRIGGLHKIAEIVVMATAVGLEIGIETLGVYYDVSQFAGIVGNTTAFSVFTFIAIMEIVSILENYAEINPDAAWVRLVLKKIKRNHAKEVETDAKHSDD